MDEQGEIEAESTDDGKVDKNPFDLGACEDKKVRGYRDSRKFFP